VSTQTGKVQSSRMVKNNNAPKFSIIIPSRNGGKYLPSCISTIISQDYTNYELIISDDNSEDSTQEYLSTLEHPKVRIIRPPERLSMAEHWDWALSHVKGEWLIFVGQDDGLQPYFFQLADKLTSLANKKNLRAIMSRRAYYYWHGCEPFYGDTVASYYASNHLETRSIFVETLITLIGLQDYFELPQMYTTSIFHHKIIDKAREKQLGRIMVTHPQDANLAAIACSLEKKYLFSNIPFGWVGSSPISVGLAVVSEGNIEMDLLKEEYLEKTNTSKLPYNPYVGDFSIGSTVLYFYGALLETRRLRNRIINLLFQSRLIKKIVLADAIYELTRKNITTSMDRMLQLKHAIEYNGFSFNYLHHYSQHRLVLYKKLIRKIRRTIRLISMSFCAVKELLGIYKKEISVSLHIDRRNNKIVSILDVQEKIREIINENKMIQNILL